VCPRGFRPERLSSRNLGKQGLVGDLLGICRVEQN
jgi:hypothetical protein